jgi:hypothetical protein
MLLSCLGLAFPVGARRSLVDLGRHVSREMVIAQCGGGQSLVGGRSQGTSKGGSTGLASGRPSDAVLPVNMIDAFVRFLVQWSGHNPNA